MRVIAAWFEIISFLFLNVYSCAAAREESCSLVENSRSDFVIVLADSAKEAEVYAAEQFAHYIKASTDVNLPQIYEARLLSNKPSKLVYIGLSKAARHKLPSSLEINLTPETTLTYISPDTIVLAGGSVRNTIYAVNEFLRGKLGIEWWTADAETVPKHKDIILEPELKIYTSTFSYRDPFFQHLKQNQGYAVRLARNGACFESDALSDKYGGSIRIAGWCHTFEQLVPANKYFDQHPEWFSLINGQRVRDGQLCLSNRQVIDVMTKEAITWIDQQKTKMISISQNDNERYCQCDNCVAVTNAAESHSGLILRAVNKIAEEIEQKYPDVIVTTLAYQYTEKPPKNIRPRKNVSVMLCSVECDFSKPISQNTKHSATKTFVENLKRWSAIAPNMTIWTYKADFQDTSNLRPNWLLIANELRLYAKNNVKGVFVQNAEDPPKYQQTNFVELMAWVTARLLWDVNQDEVQLRDKFLKGYYGHAAPYLAAYMDYMYNALENSNNLLLGFAALPADVSFLTDEVYQKSSQLFNKAQQAVFDNQDLLKKVKKEQFALDYAALNEYSIQRHRIPKSAAGIFGSDAEALTSLNSLRTLANEAGINLTLRNDYQYTLAQRIDKLEANLMLQLKSPTELGLPIQNNGWMITPEMFWIALPSHAKIIPDHNTASGQYIYLTGPFAWGSQYIVNSHMTDKSRQIYVRIEADKAENGQDGTAVTIGIHSKLLGRVLFNKEIKIDEVVGGYKWVDLGVHNLPAQSHIYFAPGPYNVAKGIKIDCIVLTESGKK